MHPGGLHRVAYTEWGDPHNPRVLLCVHGLTRHGRDFDVLARRLAAHYRVVCPDVAGRGRSAWLPSAQLYALPQYVADMVTVVARLGCATLDWFGTSMGGLIGLVLAGLDDTPVRRLLLNDIGPHLEEGGLARIAEYVGRAPRFATAEEGIAYLNGLTAPFGTHTAEQWRALNAPMLRALPDGGHTLHYDPAIGAAFHAVTPEAIALGEAALWHSLARFDGALLAVRGERSDLLSRATAEEMVRCARHGATLTIDGVGHAPAFIDPALIDLAERFFLHGDMSKPG